MRFKGDKVWKRLGMVPGMKQLLSKGGCVCPAVGTKVGEAVS